MAWRAWIVAALAIGVLGCSNKRAKGLMRGDAGDDEGVPPVALADAGAPGAAGEDQHDVSDAVRARVHADPHLSALAKDVTVVTRDGVVTLLGFAESDQERAELAIQALATPGVRRVDNRVVVRILQQ
jgi:hypothetical protein